MTKWRSDDKQRYSPVDDPEGCLEWPAIRHLDPEGNKRILRSRPCHHRLTSTRDGSGGSNRASRAHKAGAPDLQ